MDQHAITRRQKLVAKALGSLLLGLAWPLLGIIPAHAGTVTTVTLVMTDAQGNVLMTKDTQGTILARYTYRPYGTQQSGPTNAGPGYTGHVNDPTTGLVYMQQRYYDPEVGRFISPDPIGPAPGNVFNFNRFAYANNNPIVNIDLNGEDAQLYWTAPNKVTMTVKYVVAGAPIKHSAFTSAKINAEFSKLYSGTFKSKSGKSVTVTAKAVQVAHPGKGVNIVVVLPTTNGVTPSGRSDTTNNKVVRLGVGGKEAANAITASHEFGHLAGAGDQYKGGIDVNGKTLSQDVAGSSNIMKDLSGNGANAQTIQEILGSKVNTNTCAKGVTAGNGGC